MVNLIVKNGGGAKYARPVTTREEYLALRNAPENTKNFHDAREGNERAKAAQVEFCYNDLLPDGVLKGCCHPSLTFAHDIDCGDEQEQMRVKEVLLGMKDEIGLLELSGSARYGLHAVCRRQEGKTIRECQYALSMATKTEYDTNARGLARVMFTGPATADNLFYLDDSIFEESLTIAESEKEFQLLKEREEQGLEEVPPEAKKANKHYRPWENPSHPNPLPKMGEGGAFFKGIPYTSIIAEYWRRTGGEPQEGERNVRLHKLAVNLRAICDNRKDLLMQVMPRFGLSDTELKTVVDSACKEPPKGISKLMQEIISSEEFATAHPEFDDPAQADSSVFMLHPSLRKALPVGLKESLVGVPESMHMPVLCGVLPICGAYADQMEVEYCDGNRHRLGLMSIIRGEQASNKSVVKTAVDVWKRQFDEEDALARKREEEWKERKKGRKANEKAPEDPKVLIRMVPVTVSCSTLLKRLKNANGHCIYSFGEELDTLRKTNGAGSWSSKYDIYRMSFDRGEWGQDYNSDQAESGVVRVAYNWTMLGTNGALRKCFKQDNIENGLSSRILVAEMPDSSFQKMPRFGRRSAEDETRIQEAVSRLRSVRGFVDTPRLRRAIGQWVEKKRVEAAKDIDLVKDTYRKRAAVIGFRCGVIFHLLSGDKTESKACLDFARTMAGYCLEQQMKVFGEALQNEFVNAQDECQRYGSNHTVFDQLPPAFTMDDLCALKKGHCRRQSMRMIVSRWLHDGWIVKTDARHWEKLKIEKSEV